MVILFWKLVMVLLTYSTLILKTVSAVWIVEYHLNTLLGMLSAKADIAPLKERLKNIEIKEFAAHPDDKQILEQGSSHKEQSLYSWEERTWGIVFPSYWWIYYQDKITI